MKRRRLFWILTPQFIVLICAIFAAVIWLVSLTFRNFYQSELEKNLKTQVYLISQTLTEKSSKNIQEICQTLGQKTKTRITVINSSGDVVGDSKWDPQTIDNQLKRQEIQDALKLNQGVSTRYSQTSRQQMMFVAIPFQTPQQEKWIVRASLPTTSVDKTLNEFYWNLAVEAAAIALLAMGFLLLMVRRIVTPLEEMKAGAERFAAGDLLTKLPIPEASETAALAHTLNRMAQELDKRIQTVLKQHNELEAVLASMDEGVLAIDNEMKILRVNQAAANYWRLDIKKVTGQHLLEIIRNADLSHFAKKALESEKVAEEEIEIENENGHRILQVHGTVLTTSNQEHVGALMVFSDVTRLKKLELMRRDFVANVSHELKTPITSIKGFSETLLGGALKNEADAKKFTEIIQRQSNRLESIIADLMTLSNLEQNDQLSHENLIDADLITVLESARQACEHKASAKKIKITIEKPANPPRRQVNIQLMEQAVTNLVVNAINHSNENSEITLKGSDDGKTAKIQVIDQGVGISREHLPRLFERFYRVDKGRSRELGGTGLGLAIVKHIALAHGGDVTVESQLGNGSTFSINLPI